MHYFLAVTMTILLMLFATLLLTTIHEFTHYMVAKSFHYEINEFNIGFGQKLFSFQIQETQFNFKAFFFLGGNISYKLDLNSPPYQRFLISVSAPIMNVLLGIMIMLISIHHDTFNVISFHYGYHISDYFNPLYNMKFNLHNWYMYNVLKISVVFIGIYSFLLGVFNLIPLPPFDGFNALFHLYSYFIPKEKILQHYSNCAKYGFGFFLLLNGIILVWR